MENARELERIHQRVRIFIRNLEYKYVWSEEEEEHIYRDILDNIYSAMTISKPEPPFKKGDIIHTWCDDTPYEVIKCSQDYVCYKDLSGETWVTSCLLFLPNPDIDCTDPLTEE